MKSRLLLSLTLMAGLSLSGAAQVATQPDALLKTGDLVKVVLFRFNGSHITGQTQGSVPIVDGKLRVPLLGDVQAAGLTVEELKLVLEGRYAKRVSDRHEIRIAVGVPAPNFKYELSR